MHAALANNGAVEARTGQHRPVICIDISQSQQAQVDLDQVVQVGAGPAHVVAQAGRDHTHYEYVQKSLEAQSQLKDELCQFSDANFGDSQSCRDEKTSLVVNENFNLFKDLLSGIDKDIDLADMVLNENSINYTNAISEMDQSSNPATTVSSSHDASSALESSSSLTIEDFNVLNDIFNEIVELKNSSDRDLSLEASLKPGPTIKRLDSIGTALGDYNLTDFDIFETSIQINDPMLGVDVLNKTLNIF